MLVLTRRVGERLRIGDGVVVEVLALRRGQIRLGISAPPSVPIRREELPHRSGKAAELQGTWRRERDGALTPLAE